MGGGLLATWTSKQAMGRHFPMETIAYRARAVIRLSSLGSLLVMPSSLRASVNKPSAVGLALLMTLAAALGHADQTFEDFVDGGGQVFEPQKSVARDACQAAMPTETDHLKVDDMVLLDVRVSWRP